MTISIPGVEGDRDRLRLLRDGVREDMVVMLCWSVVPDMVRLLVDPDTMMLPLACVADRLVVETDMMLLLLEPDTMMLPLA